MVVLFSICSTCSNRKIACSVSGECVNPIKKRLAPVVL